jgi:hypothetical protein
MWILLLLVLCVEVVAQTPKQALDPKEYEQIKRKIAGQALVTVESSRINTNAIRRDAHRLAEEAAAKQAEAIKAANTAALAAETAARTAGDMKITAEAAAGQALVSAASVKVQNTTLLIVQSFALLTFLCLLAERLWYRLQDSRRERRDHQWQLDATKREEELAATVRQVHTLVNSNYTVALENELDARKSNLVLLKANLLLVQSSGKDNADTIRSLSSTVASTSIKISELTKTLAERALQTATAEKQLQVDMQKIQ